MSICIDNSAVTSPMQETTSESWKQKKAMEIKKQLETLLFNSGMVKFTNKSQRKIKKLFNEQINLTDSMFQGFHTDGSEIGSLNDDEKEINLLYQVLKKTPTLSFEKATNTIKKWISQTKMGKCVKTKEDTEYAEFIDYVEEDEGDKVKLEFSKKHELIIKAYQKYMEEVKNKKVEVKTRGLDLTSKCAEYWMSDSIDPVIEEQINKTADELYKFISSSFDEKFTFEDFSRSLVLVLDISGSMRGTPLHTGLFYMLLMVKIFKIDTLHYFHSDIIVKNICQTYSSNLELIKKIYLNSMGSTNLKAIFKHLNKINTKDKNIVIITDGDCDPQSYRFGKSSNPFHEVTRFDKKASAYPNITNCHYIVVNVSKTEMNFPYLDIDPMVCYLTGNNPKTMNGFIKALCESTKTGEIITPQLVLKYTLTLDELIFSKPIPTFTKVMTDERISELFKVFTDNLPPK